jgi:hypothetical protein
MLTVLTQTQRTNLFLCNEINLDGETYVKGKVYKTFHDASIKKGPYCIIIQYRDGYMVMPKLRTTMATEIPDLLNDSFTYTATWLHA